MLESMTIFTLGGCILYQYCAVPSLVKHHQNSDDYCADDVGGTGSTTNISSGAPLYTKHLINSVLMEQFLLVEYAAENQNINNIKANVSAAANKNYHITDGMTLHWKKHIIKSPLSSSGGSSSSNNNNNASAKSAGDSDTRETTIYVVAIYPDILFEGPRQYLKVWAEHLVMTTIREYDVYYRHTWSTSVSQQQQQQQQQQQHNESRSLLKYHFHHRPDAQTFDGIFRIVLNTSKTQKQPSTSSVAATTTSTSEETSSTNTTNSNSTSTGTKKSSSEKVQRNWYDGKGTITEKAMAALDKSHMGTTGSSNNTGDSNNKEDIQQLKQEQYERALRDARMAYLPSAEEINETEDIITSSSSATKTTTTTTTTTITQSSWIVGIFQQVMGTKVLTKQDVQKPIQMIVTKLQQKNVSLSVAQEIGTVMEQQLVGHTLNSFYTIQTAVQQALESILMKILVQSQKGGRTTGSSGITNNNNKKDQNSNIDLMQLVIQKRTSQTSIWSSFSNSSNTNSKRRPYVISVMGINGIGKTTTIAKLAYYFQQHQLTPMLVAGDTFRSGAIEQLRIHADCLNVPFYQQGYSKDPSSVAAAAIAYATEQQYDVVLIDTAGRMQNNVPLMKSLNKLMIENQPDYCIMVCEAIVGHDGIHQFQMFQQALGNARKVDGLILTKFDTVDTKVGACLTLTYECQTPILFLGVGQKYHHLQPLQVSTIMNGLFA